MGVVGERVDYGHPSHTDLLKEGGRFAKANHPLFG